MAQKVVLDDGSLDYVIHHLGTLDGTRKERGFSTRFSRVSRSFQSKIFRRARMVRKLVIKCEVMEGRDSFYSNGIENSDTLSDDCEYKSSLLNVEMNGISYRDLSDVGRVLRFLCSNGADINEINFTYFSVDFLPFGFEELRIALEDFRSTEKIKFGDWKSVATRHMGSIVDRNWLTLRTLENIPPEVFLKLSADVNLDFMQMHAKMIRHAYENISEGCGKEGDMYVFEADEKIQALLNCGAKCNELAILGHNDTRKHSLHSELLNCLNIRQIYFKKVAAKVFSDELRWFRQWEQSGQRFEQIEELKFEVDDELTDLKERVLEVLRMARIIFPKSMKIEIICCVRIPVDTIVIIMGECEHAVFGSGVFLLLNLLIAKSDIPNCNKEAAAKRDLEKYFGPPYKLQVAKDMFSVISSTTKLHCKIL